MTVKVQEQYYPRPSCQTVTHLVNKMSDGRSLGWCFTLNNPEEDCLVTLVEQAQYTIAGKEVGACGTPHLQGYCFFKTKKSLTQLKKYLPRAHWEPQRGSFEQAIEYCKKDGDWHEEGIPPMSRKRKGEVEQERWKKARVLAESGQLKEIDDDIYVRFYSSLRNIQKDNSPMPADADDVTGEWLWGPTGTGKSRFARDNNPGFYLKLCNKWWDGYRNEDCAILEDFDKSHSVLGHHLKIWADRYSFPAEIKGGKINIRPKKIIVTSNYHPSEIWGNEPQTLEPIERRFQIKHFTQNFYTLGPEAPPRGLPSAASNHPQRQEVGLEYLQ